MLNRPFPSRFPCQRTHSLHTPRSLPRTSVARFIPTLPHLCQVVPEYFLSPSPKGRVSILPLLPPPLSSAYSFLTHSPRGESHSTPSPSPLSRGKLKKTSTNGSLTSVFFEYNSCISIRISIAPLFLQLIFWFFRSLVQSSPLFHYGKESFSHSKSSYRLPSLVFL